LVEPGCYGTKDAGTATAGCFNLFHYVLLLSALRQKVRLGVDNGSCLCLGRQGSKQDRLTFPHLPAV
jgi:hypothetical protein